MSKEVYQALTHHWALDSLAAEAMTSELNVQEEERILGVAETLGKSAVVARDQHRREVTSSFAEDSGVPVCIEGPCSVDESTNYNEFFDVMEWLQSEYPSAKIGVRINGKKPRTKGGWRGLAYSTNPEERKRLHDIFREANKRQFATFCEITDGQELGEYAPYLTGFWLGMRDQPSTALRSATSAYHLPYGVKNGINGDTESVENTIVAVGMNSEQNDGSGVNLGTIASGPDHRGVPTGILPVGEGNKAAAIIARGYALPKDTPSEVGRRLALEHISEFCRLGQKLGSIVLIDKTHGAPPMFGIDRKSSNRLLEVNREIADAMESGEIEAADYIRGEVAEIGPEKGRTDPNFIVNWQNRGLLGEMVGRALAHA